MNNQKPMKTRCYYTEYVNHMLRFYLTCPDSLKIDNVKRRADVENWIAVQSGLHCLSEENREKVLEIYRTNYNIPQAVADYCQKTGEDERRVWTLVTKASSLIARCRGLI